MKHLLLTFPAAAPRVKALRGTHPAAAPRIKSLLVALPAAAFLAALIAADAFAGSQHQHVQLAAAR